MLCVLTQLQDVWQLSWERRFARLLLPMSCSLVVGEVARGFPKVGVVVVTLSKPLRVGDVIQFSRPNEQGHTWFSAPVRM